jgi:PhnB protein
MKETNTYLIFNGNCRQAMTFYGKCLGIEPQIMSFGDMPAQPGCPTTPETKDLVMHARIGQGPKTFLMASDTQPGMPFKQGDNFSISINCDSAQEVDKYFNALVGDGGKVTMPPQETFWAARFGMGTDKFGVNWMFNFEGKKQ